MHREELTLEGLHVMIQPDWREQVEHGIAHLEAHHPGVFTRVAVRFIPIKPHHPGMTVSIDGRVDLQNFHVARAGKDPLSALHKAFAVVARFLHDRARRSHGTADPMPTEMAREEALMDAETAPTGS